MTWLLCLFVFNLANDYFASLAIASCFSSSNMMLLQLPFILFNSPDQNFPFIDLFFVSLSFIVLGLENFEIDRLPLEKVDGMFDVKQVLKLLETDELAVILASYAKVSKECNKRGLFMSAC